MSSTFKVLLIGDSCEDEYIYGKCEKINSEAPVPVIKFSKVETKAGMAANVCLNLQAFGVDITFLTNSEKIVKTRFIDEKSNHQILRVDNEEKIKPLLLPISTNNFDAIIIYDRDKGYVTESKIFEIVNQSSCPIFVASKKQNLPNKNNCYIITDEYRDDIENLIVSMGSKGCVYKNTLYPLENIKVYNMIGTNDIFLSSLVYGFLKYAKIDNALCFANKAFSIAVQQKGSYILSDTDIDSLCEN